jgi:hypothetical protein
MTQDERAASLTDLLCANRSSLDDGPLEVQMTRRRRHCHYPAIGPPPVTNSSRSKCFEPFKDRGVRAPQRDGGGRVIEGPRLLDGFPFHLEIDGCIPIGRCDAGVSEPLTDRDDVDARSEQVHGRTVPVIRRVELEAYDGRPPAARGCRHQHDPRLARAPVLGHHEHLRRGRSRHESQGPGRVLDSRRLAQALAEGARTHDLPALTVNVTLLILTFYTRGSILM